jgi:hypothetical protein
MIRELAAWALLGTAVVAPPAGDGSVLAEGPCQVTSWSMEWGFKESFRAYLSGAIAGGEWQVAEDVRYSTPSFFIESDSGHFSPDGKTAELSSRGSIRFVGHEGLLDQTLSDPRFMINEGVATVVFDVAGETQEGVPVSATAVPFVSVDVSDASLRDDTWSVSAAPTVLTAEGADAFGTYPSGEPFDPVDLRVNLEPGCLQQGPSGSWFLGLGIGSAVTVALAIVLVRKWRARERLTPAES